MSENEGLPQYWCACGNAQIAGKHGKDICEGAYSNDIPFTEDRYTDGGPLPQNVKDVATAIVKLINEPGTTSKTRRNLLVLRYGFTWEEAREICPDSARDY